MLGLAGRAQLHRALDSVSLLFSEDLDVSSFIFKKNGPKTMWTASVEAVPV